jgi:cellulose synthase/poly-beta-1,6-N-acetylglucosamine synthase-like glycosyltransferase
MTVSIIIPLKQDQGYLKACLEACFHQDVPVEVIVLPDEKLPFEDSRTKVEGTGPVSPARKRNRGVELSSGEILAFIDDDTRPHPGWLKSALKAFEDSQIAAVGGPSITPTSDPFWAQVSGAVYESWMMSGKERLRYVPTREQNLDDFPSCNLLVRRSVFQEVGGFATDFWPGEDTEFCLSLVKRGHVIRYVPEAVIDHHRRPSLERHFKQLGNYGLHRGYFVKRYPETSCRLPYFMPSLMVLGGVILTILAIMKQPLALQVLLGLSVIYFSLSFLSLIHKPFRLALPAICVMFASHCKYGISFLRGLFARRLPEEN